VFLRGRQQRSEHVDRRGLPSSIGAEQTEDLTGVNRKRYRIDRSKRPEAPRETLHFQYDFAHNLAI
jgi:hypothetical protein